MVSLENKFAKNPEFAELYRKQINEYIDLGHAVKLTNDHSLNIPDISNYVPHHGVLNINKAGRVSVVFDASAKYNNTCLNQNLLPGPDLLNNLVSVLIRFHQGMYVVMADIEKMFHQIFVSPNDTNALRFLWRKSPDEIVSDYKMLVHIFGKVDLPCCVNWALKVLEMVDKSLKTVVANNFYMDDFLSSLYGEESLIGSSLLLILCLKTCGFRLKLF